MVRHLNSGIRADPVPDSDSNQPSTPPDTGNGNIPPQSERRESTRLRTPLTRPGFISTHGDSRCSLVPETPAPATRRPRVPKNNNTTVTVASGDENNNEPHAGGRDTTPTTVFAGTTQVAVRNGAQVTIDTAQDSDAENEKHANQNKKRKDPTKDKDGSHRPRLGVPMVSK
ncbi:hypothetical protein PtB15_8B196 [Puccinia triticina]|nr:hypothetical protein PtB15_8B196 [Puccinia triticina]